MVPMPRLIGRLFIDPALSFDCTNTIKMSWADAACHGDDFMKSRSAGSIDEFAICSPASYSCVTADLFKS